MSAFSSFQIKICYFFEIEQYFFHINLKLQELMVANCEESSTLNFHFILNVLSGRSAIRASSITSQISPVLSLLSPNEGAILVIIVKCKTKGKKLQREFNEKFSKLNEKLFMEKKFFAYFPINFVFWELHSQSLKFRRNFSQNLFH